MHEKLIQIDPSKLDFSDAPVLLNRSKRFVLPIPELPDGGEELRYPKGHEKAGEPIYTNHDGSPQRGIVFANHTDSGWQGVQGNGKEAIIINDLSEAQARILLAKVNEITPDITKASAEQVQQILRFTREEIGVVDMFDKDLESVSRQMRFVDGSRPGPDLGDPKTFLGYMEVSKDTEHRAIRIDRAFAIQGPVLQRYPRGGIVVNDGNYTWGIDKDVCQRNWKVKNWAGNEETIQSLEEAIRDHSL